MTRYLALLAFVSTPALAQSTTGAWIGDTGRSTVAQGVASLIKRQNTDIIGLAGDLRYGTSTVAQAVDGAGYGAVKSKLIAAPGNHDYSDCATPSDCANYNGGNLGQFTSYFGTGTYGSKRVSPLVEVFWMNSDKREKDGITKGSKQYNWIKAAAARSDAPHKICLFHHQLYSSKSSPSSFKDWDFEAMGFTMCAYGHIHQIDVFKRDDNKDGKFIYYVQSGLGGHNCQSGKQSVIPSGRLWGNYCGNLGFGALFTEHTQYETRIKVRTVNGAVLFSDSLPLPTAPGAGTPPPDVEICSDGVTVLIGDEPCPGEEPPPAPTPTGESPSGTVLTTTAGIITDSAGATWKLKPTPLPAPAIGLGIYRAPAGGTDRHMTYTQNITQLLYFNKVLYHRSGTQWYRKTTNNWDSWTKATDPRGGVVVPPPPPPPPPPPATSIAPPAPPIITSAPKNYGGSTQIQFLGATTPGVYKNMHAIQTYKAFVFKDNRTLPTLIEDILVDKSKEFVSQDGTEPEGVNNVTIRRFKANANYRGIYIRNDSSNWLIEDGHLYSKEIGGDGIPMGIQFKETAHNVIVRRVVIEGYRLDPLQVSGYTNGDGIVTERGNYGLTFEDIVVRNCSDGGFDMKSATTRVDRALVENCGRNYRFWVNMKHGRLISKTPVSVGDDGAKPGLHFWIGGSASEIVIDDLLVESTNTAPIFFSDSTVPLKIILKKHSFKVPAGTKLVGRGVVSVVDGDGKPITL